MVDKTQHMFHLILFITIGNQKWQGAIPSFIKTLIKRKIALPCSRWEVKALIKRRPEARA